MKAIASSPPCDTALVELLDADLATDLEGLPRHLWERALGAPAREFLSRPGKQFRAQLVQSAWVMAGADLQAMPEELPHILELLHAGSLIVDDIEDQADTRRDAPALHRIYGVPLALNTGNWMYFWALNLVESLPLDAVTRAALTREACRAVERCHRGQALDLAMQVTELDQSEIGNVVRATTRLKTGALMELAAVLGAIAAGANEVRIEALRSFGRSLGEGLQMLDDLGGITSPQRAHKATEDLVNDRPTWPWAWLARCCTPDSYEKYRERLARVVRGDGDATSLAASLGGAVATKGRMRVHSSLRLSLAELEGEFGPIPAVCALRGEIVRLEKSYE